MLPLLLISAVALYAQPTDDQTIADSLLWDANGLFQDTTFTAPLGSARSGEKAPAQHALPGGWAPEFPLTAPIRRQDLLALEDSPPLLLSYDRADGLYLGVGANTPAAMFRARRLRGYFGFGYAFGSHYWQVFGGFSQDFLTRAAPLRIGTEGHIITDTRDAWKMDVNENTAYALLAGEDHRDYFQRSGFSITAQQFITPRIGFGLKYQMDNYHRSKREIGWSLFGPKQPFFEVPAVREGNMSSVIVDFTLDEIGLRSWDDPQFGLQAQAEFGSMTESFQHYVVDLRLRTTLIESRLWLAVHARAGSATGDAPPQRLFTIGGHGTIPGYPQNAYVGNRMLLLAGDLLIAPIKGLGVRLILSNDFASATTTGAGSGLAAGFLNDISDLKYSPSIYIGSAGGTFRAGFAFRTDVFEDPRFILRLSRPF